MKSLNTSATVGPQNARERTTTVAYAGSIWYRWSRRKSKTRYGATPSGAQPHRLNLIRFSHPDSSTLTRWVSLFLTYCSYLVKLRNKEDEIT